MKNSKFRNVHGRTFLNNGIHAAAANSPQRTTSTTEGVFCTLLASVSSIFKSAGLKIYGASAFHRC